MIRGDLRADKVWKWIANVDKGLLNAINDDSWWFILIYHDEWSSLLVDIHWWRFLTYSSGMTSQLLKPPSSSSFGIQQNKTDITPVMRDESTVNEDIVEEKTKDSDQVILINRSNFRWVLMEVPRELSEVRTEGRCVKNFAWALERWVECS